MKSSSSYILLTMLIGSALIGMVSAQTAEVSFDGEVPAVLIIRWDNVRDMGWVFNESQWDTCSNGEKVGTTCYFNDGSPTSAADLYMEYNDADTWEINFSAGAGQSDAKLHRDLTPQFTPTNDLNMTRHTSGTGDTYAPFNTKVWTVDTDDPDCSITTDIGGSCNVGIEVQQGITQTEISPGAGRLKQGTYSATIIADMIV